MKLKNTKNKLCVLKFLFSQVIIILAFSTFSCKNENKISNSSFIAPLQDTMHHDSLINQKAILDKLDYAIENLRVSDELLTTLSLQPNLYEEQQLLDSKKANEFMSSKSKALILGVYGADLNYILHFSQINTSMKYMMSAKQLCDDLGVLMAFDEKIIKRYSENVGSKDSLVSIVLTSYDFIRKYLRNEQQFQLSSLVIAGASIENMYLTLNSFPKFKLEKEKTVLIAQIKSQQEYMLKIYDLLVQLNQSDDYNHLLVQIKAICDAFKPVCGNKALAASDIAILRNKVSLVREIIISSK